MTTLVSAGTEEHGLGLSRMTTSCGIELWGQRGGYGFEALTVSTRDTPYRMTLYISTGHLAPAGTAVRDITDAGFCPPPQP